MKNTTKDERGVRRENAEDDEDEDARGRGFFVVNFTTLPWQARQSPSHILVPSTRDGLVEVSISRIEDPGVDLD